MSFQESDAIDALLKLSLPGDTMLQLPAIQPQQSTNVSLPNLSCLLSSNSESSIATVVSNQDQIRFCDNQDQVRFYDNQDLTAKRNLLKTLSRAATMTVQKSVGRPKKKAACSKKQQISRSNSIISDSSSSKPRWQEAERLELLEAIVKEKNLDDMKSIRWDRIAMAVGRAKKACKDQWRREVLPNLLKNLKSSK